MGSIRRPRQGRGWEARYRDPAGRQRSTVFRTKREAEKFLDRVGADQQRGEWRDPRLAQVPFGNYAADWLRSTKHLRPGTLANVESRLRRHILPAFEGYKIAAIHPAAVRLWVAELTSGGLSPATVAAIYGTFARIMRTAEIDGLIPHTPCIGISLPRETAHQEMHFLNHGEVSLLASELDERYRALIFMAAYTGLRWGELAGLHTDRINFLRATVDVVEALTEVNGRVAVGPTKTGARRTVSLPRFLVEMLSEHVTRFPTTTGLVFSSSQGQALRRNFYRRHFKPAVARTALPASLRFHDLRHSCAAMLIAQGAHPKEIQERLGHSTIRLTFDRYGHLFPGLDERLREGLDAAYRQAQGEEDPDSRVYDFRSRGPAQGSYE